MTQSFETNVMPVCEPAQRVARRAEWPEAGGTMLLDVLAGFGCHQEAPVSS